MGGIRQETRKIERIWTLTNTEALLEERGSVHGDFRTQFKISSIIKKAMRLGEYPLDEIEGECIDMIAVKLSRLVCGKRNIDDVDDLIGYATLLHRYRSDDQGVNEIAEKFKAPKLPKVVQDELEESLAGTQK
jgi:hypothetical protein